MRKVKVFWLPGLLLMTIVAFSSAQNAGNDIILKDEPLAIKPEGFYIAKVTDDRPTKEAIALLAIPSGANKPVMQQANLQGGAATQLQRYISHNLAFDTKDTPVEISIKKLKLTETILPNGNVDGRISLNFSFGLAKDYGTKELIAYDGGLHYIRPINSGNLIEAQLRTVIKSALIYFNTWMRDNRNAYQPLATRVLFNFIDFVPKTEGDTIYYNAKRPLVWSDFQSGNRPSLRFEASVMPGFGYELHQAIKNGVISVNIVLKTYLAKSDSWAGSQRDAYGLNHEQRHFDIARVITRRYQQKVLRAGLTPDKYEAFINMQYLDSYRDMDTLQKAYDSETRHGINEAAQQFWDRKIDEMLKKE